MKTYYPEIFTEHESDSNGLTGKWETIKEGIPMTIEEWKEAYRLPTE